MPSKNFDLICPFEVPATEMARERAWVTKDRLEGTMRVFAHQQLTNAERQVLDDLRASAERNGNRGSAKVRSIKHSGHSVESLREAEERRRKRD